MPRKSAKRETKSQPARDPDDKKPSVEDTPKSDGHEASKEDAEFTGWRYHVRQQAGLGLAVLSIFLAAVTFDEHSEWAVTKMICCLTLCMVATGIHEIRPYQRRGYGSIWWEQMTAGVSEIGQGQGAAVPTASFGRNAQGRQ